VPRADRRAGDAQAGHRQTGVGPGGQVQLDDAGIAGQRIQAVALAPSGIGGSDDGQGGETAITVHVFNRMIRIAKPVSIRLT
jgi:hypothetical protein